MALFSFIFFRFNQQRRICQRQRDRASLPSDPADLDNVDENFSKTLNGRNFLLPNAIEKGKRILIFSTTNNLTSLSQTEKVILDGTFAMTSKGFQEIFTVHGSIGRAENLPLLSIFWLPDKAKTTYKRALILLKKICCDGFRGRLNECGERRVS